MHDDHTECLPRSSSSTCLESTANGLKRTSSCSSIKSKSKATCKRRVRCLSDLGSWFATASLAPNEAGEVESKFGLREKASLIWPILLGLNKDNQSHHHSSPSFHSPDHLAESAYLNLFPPLREALKASRHNSSADLMASRTTDRSHRKTLPVISSSKRYREKTLPTSSSTSILDMASSDRFAGLSLSEGMLELGKGHSPPTQSDSNPLDEDSEDQQSIGPTASELVQETMELKFQQTRKKRQQMKSRSNRGQTQSAAALETLTKTSKIAQETRDQQSGKYRSKTSSPEESDISIVSQISSALCDTPVTRVIEESKPPADSGSNYHRPLSPPPPPPPLPPPPSLPPPPLPLPLPLEFSHPIPPSPLPILGISSKSLEVSSKTTRSASKIASIGAMFSDEEAEDSGLEFSETRSGITGEPDGSSIGKSGSRSGVSPHSSRTLSRTSMISSNRPASADIDSAWDSQVETTEGVSGNMKERGKLPLGGEMASWKSYKKEDGEKTENLGEPLTDENRNVIEYESVEEESSKKVEPLMKTKKGQAPKLKEADLEDISKATTGDLIDRFGDSGCSLTDPIVSETVPMKSGNFRDHDTDTAQYKSLLDDGKANNEDEKQEEGRLTVARKRFNASSKLHSENQSNSDANGSVVKRDVQDEKIAAISNKEATDDGGYGQAYKEDQESWMKPCSTIKTHRNSPAISNEAQSLRSKRLQQRNERRSTSDPVGGSLINVSQITDSKGLKRASITVPFSGPTISRGVAAGYFRPTIASLRARYEYSPSDDGQHDPYLLSPSSSSLPPASLASIDASNQSATPQIAIRSAASRKSSLSSGSSASAILRALDQFVGEEFESILPSSTSSSTFKTVLPIQGPTRPTGMALETKSVACQVSPNLMEGLRKTMGLNTDIDMKLMSRILDKILTKRCSTAVQTEETWVRQKSQFKRPRTNDVAVGTEKFSRERFSSLPDTRSKFTQTEVTCIRTKNKAVSTDDRPTTAVEVVSLPKRPKFKIARELPEPSKVSKDVQTDLPPAKKDAMVEAKNFSEAESSEGASVVASESETSVSSDSSVESLPKKALPLTAPRKSEISGRSRDLVKKSKGTVKRLPSLSVQTRGTSFSGSEEEGRYSRASTLLEEQSIRIGTDRPIAERSDEEELVYESRDGQVYRSKMSDRFDPEEKKASSETCRVEKHDKSTSTDQQSSCLVPNDQSIVHPSSQVGLVERGIQSSDQYSEIIARLARQIKTSSKVIVSINQNHRRQVSEVTSYSELDKDGKLSRKTQVTTSTKVPVLESIQGPIQEESLQRVELDDDTESNRTQPVITSPPLSKTPQSCSRGTIISEATPSNTRPSSSMDVHNYQARSTASMPPTPAYSEIDIDVDREPLFSPIPQAIGESSDKKGHLESDGQNSAKKPSTADYQLMRHVNGVLAAKLMRQSAGTGKPQHQVTWHESSNSTISSELSTDPFRDENGRIVAPKGVSISNETVIVGKGQDSKVETRSRASRVYSNQAICEPEIRSETILDDSPPIKPKLTHQPKTQETSQSKLSLPKMETRKVQKDCEMMPTESLVKQSESLNCKLPVDTDATQETNIRSRDQSMSSLSASSPPRSRHPSSGAWNKVFNSSLPSRTNTEREVHKPFVKSLSAPKITDLRTDHYIPITTNDPSEIRKLEEKTRSHNQFLTPSTAPITFTSPQPTESVDSEYKMDGTGEHDLRTVQSSPSASRFEVPQISSNAVRQDSRVQRDSKGETQIVTALTKTFSPETFETVENGIPGVRIRKPASSKVVLEQNLTSGDAKNGPDGCKISSSLALKTPIHSRHHPSKKKMQSMKDLRIEQLVNEEEKRKSKLKAASSMDSIHKKSAKSSHVYTQQFRDSPVGSEVINRPGEVITTSKFERQKIPKQGRNPETTTWEYSMECNCVNGMNTSLRTSVKHKRSYIPFTCTLYESSV